MVKIIYKNVEINMKVDFDEDGEGAIQFHNPNNGQWVEHLSQMTSGWSFQDIEDQKALEIIIEYIKNIDWDIWLQDVENDDVYEINITKDIENPDIEIIQVERVGK